MATAEFRSSLPPSFLSLGEGALGEMERSSELRTFAAGARIFKTGEETDGLFVVVSGAVEVWVLGGTSPVRLAALGAGELLGEMSLFGDRQRHADANAGSEGAQLRFFPLTTMQRLQQLYPADYLAGLRQLINLVVHRLDVTNHRLVERLAAERSDGITRDLVVHDLRSPLAVIDTAVQAILQRPEIYGAVSQKQRTALVRVGKTLAFLRLLTDSILEVERARQGRTRAQATSLAEVLHACAAPLLSMVSPERWMQQEEESFELALQGTRLVLPARESLMLPLRADPLRLAQVVMNLIGNAIRYTTGPVELTAAQSGEAMVIDIADHGSGIPPEQREAIFSPFKQQTLRDGRLPVGKGFGLAGVREMVVSMGASLTVLDRADQKPGACFRLQLPSSAG